LINGFFYIQESGQVTKTLHMYGKYLFQRVVQYRYINDVLSMNTYCTVYNRKKLVGSKSYKKVLRVYSTQTTGKYIYEETHSFFMSSYLGPSQTHLPPARGPSKTYPLCRGKIKLEKEGGGIVGPKKTIIKKLCASKFSPLSQEPIK
jgi:hypothetical protein